MTHRTRSLRHTAVLLPVIALLLGPEPRAGGAAEPSAYLTQQERAAVDLLRRLWFAEERVRALGVIDIDGDAAGEYAFLAELGGTVHLRGSAAFLEPVGPLPAGLGAVDLNGFGEVEDYFFALYLPGVGAVPYGEAPAGGDPGGLDDDLAEAHFRCYAWPSANSPEAARSLTFAIDEAGVLCATAGDVTPYFGVASPPVGDSAALHPNDVTSSLAALAPGVGGQPARGEDGNLWIALADE